jgi:hypothetical protein
MESDSDPPNLRNSWDAICSTNWRSPRWIVSVSVRAWLISRACANRFASTLRVFLMQTIMTDRMHRDLLVRPLGNFEENPVNLAQTVVLPIAANGV